MEQILDFTEATEAETIQVKRDEPGKCKTALHLAENTFSLFMLSVFIYMSGKYLYNKYLNGGVDETLFWNIFNHLTPLFVLRGIQINTCSFIDNIKKLCQPKANEQNQNLNNQPLLTNEMIQ